MWVVWVMSVGHCWWSCIGVNCWLATWIAFGWLSMVVVDSRGWVCVLWVVWVTVMGREVTINYVFRCSSICVGLLFFFFFLIKFVWVCYSQFLLAIFYLFIRIEEGLMLKIWKRNRDPFAKQLFFLLLSKFKNNEKHILETSFENIFLKKGNQIVVLDYEKYG